MTTRPAYSTRLAVLAIALHFAIAPAAFAQGAPAGPPEADQMAAEEARGFSADQLEQMVAPVALYPDALLMQVFMAATYPLEIVEADRWVKKNADLTGDALDAAAAKEGWDASVQSLTHFPGVLSRMSENLDWTKDLGDAFLGQQADVLNAVQVMRQKAYAAGNLQTNAEQKITVEPVTEPSTTTVVVKQPTQVIRIEPAQPQVIYVPTYSPTVVYGAPPATVYYPTVYSPAYVATASVISFGVGMAIGAAIWGDCDWHHYGVYGYPGYYGGGYRGSYWGGGNYHGGHNNITINGDVNINGRPGNGNWNGNRPGGGNRPPQWGHKPEHRKSVGYGNNKVATTYGGRAQTRPAPSDGARGYDRSNLGANNKAGFGGGANAGAGNKAGFGGGANAGAGNKGNFGGGAGANNKGSLGGAGNKAAPGGGSNKGSFGGGAGANTKGSYGGAGNKAAPVGGSNKGSYGGAGAGTKDKGSFGGGSSSRDSGAFGGRGASVDRAASSRGASSRGGGSNRSFGGGGGGGGRSMGGGGGGGGRR